MTDDFEMFDNAAIGDAPCGDRKYGTIVGEDASGNTILQFLDFTVATVKKYELIHLGEFEEIEFVKDKLCYLDKLAQTARDFLKDNQVEPY